MIIIGNATELSLLNYLLKTENHYLRLFTNNLTINNSTVLNDLTQMNTLGYSQKLLTPESWVSNSSQDGSYLEYPPQQWNFTPVQGAPAVLIYGYYLVGVTSGLLKVSEKFYPSAESIQYGLKDTLNLTVRIGID